MGAAIWTIIRITADSDEKNRVRAVFDWGDGKGKNEKKIFTLEPGETETFEFTAEQGIRSIGYSIMVGKVTVEVVEDMRPTAEQKPF